MNVTSCEHLLYHRLQLCPQEYPKMNIKSLKVVIWEKPFCQGIHKMPSLESTCPPVLSFTYPPLAIPKLLDQTEHIN